MGNRKTEKSKTENRGTGKAVLTFTVAECSEFHTLGAYYEGIRTLDEAVRIYNKIPPQRLHGIPAIGINLHVEGTDTWEDSQADILTGGEIDVGFINHMPEFRDNPQAQAALKEIIARFPERELLMY